MNTFLYWPYDEVTLDVTADRETVLVTTPWIQARVPVTAENKSSLQTLVTQFSTKQLGPSDMALVQRFFRDLRKYPFCYILPAEKSHGTLDIPQSHGTTLSVSAMEHQILHGAGRTSFEWDVNAALTFAAVGNKIHPESVFSVVRRFHHLEVLENDKGKEAFAFIETLKGEAFTKAVSIVVRQNHYVTQKCQESLAPAAEIAGKAKAKVTAFLKEENGHDLILGAALKSIVGDPELVPICPQTIQLMQLLKFAAARNFLAFAMIVDFFERSSYQKTDPLAQLLMKGGFEKAARQVNRHMEINDAGEHENIACDFLYDMAPCDTDYATEAIRIAEAVSTVMNRVTASAVDLFKSNP